MEEEIFFGEMQEYWDFIKNRDYRYLNEILDINSDYIEDVYNKTEKTLARCKKAYDDEVEIKDIFIDENQWGNYGDNYDENQGLIDFYFDMHNEGPLILHWIYALTRRESLYDKTNWRVEKILEDKYGEGFKRKEESEYQVFKLYKKSKEPEINFSQSLTLKSIFKEEWQYNVIICKLIDKGHIQTETYIWIDKNGAYKKTLSAILNHLHNQGYYNRIVTDEELIEIALNTFKVPISMRTFKYAKLNRGFQLDYIPSAASLTPLTHKQNE